MRKSIFVGLAALFAAFVMGALPASADHGDTPSDVCASGDGAPVLASDGASFISVCVPDVGATTAAVTGDDDGYVVVDGDDDNALTAVSQCLDGHIGVEVTDGTPAVVAGDGEDVNGDDHAFVPGEGGAPGDPSVCIPA